MDPHGAPFANGPFNVFLIAKDSYVQFGPFRVTRHVHRFTNGVPDSCGSSFGAFR